jgi:hypothetical protein
MGPDDALSRHELSRPERAAAELADVLPAELAARIEWSTLRLEPGSFVDPGPAGRATDLPFSARASSKARADEVWRTGA